MIYSHTQIAQYLRCPRQLPASLPLDGWREKETRAAMVFGRCFEQALAAYFQGNDCTAALFKEWGAFRDAPFEYKKGESWDRFVHQGVHLLERFAQDDRVRIENPESDLQVKLRPGSFPENNEFVALASMRWVNSDGRPCLIDWKTTTSRYPEEAAEGLLALDPAAGLLSSGSAESPMWRWRSSCARTGPEIQYLQAAISERERRDYGRLVETTIGQLESGQFSSHSGIRFPQNGCMSCSHLGLCLENQALIRAHLIRKPGASDLDWLDELVD